MAYRKQQPPKTWADEGAVRQQGPRVVQPCRKCGANVVLLKSNRTGRWYTGQVFRYGGDGPPSYYYVSRPHQCRPAWESPDARAERVDRTVRRQLDQVDPARTALFRMMGVDDQPIDRLAPDVLAHVFEQLQAVDPTDGTIFRMLGIATAAEVRARAAERRAR